MSEIWKPFDIEVYKQWITDILNEASDDLSDWETKFIESVDERFARGQQLSELQAEKLESIYASKTK